ncbi:LysR substrate-binding domain-containing protein [[Pseudomonas] boreopolis]|uniref:LysR substrate-binding domain-containing protein n=1 Tax=Xanthomonas boreopolis TaxID=86183 RepID=UPI003D9B6EBC
MFRAVALQQSITRAAELLGRVPSNVTTRIQQLEAEVGVPLFQRDRKRMELTPEGVAFLDYAEKILNLADEAVQVVNPAGPRGVLRVGSMESAVATRLASPLAQFNARWPEVALDLTTGPTRQLVDALLARRIDCAFVAAPSEAWWEASDALDRTPVFREELVLLLPPGHPRAARPEQIGPRALAAFAPGCTYRMLAEDWIAGSASRPVALQVHEVRSYHAMVACTAAGACFSVLPRRVLDLFPDAARFTVVPLVRADTWLVSRPGFKTPAFEAFRDLVVASSDFAGRGMPQRAHSAAAARDPAIGRARGAGSPLDHQR